MNAINKKELEGKINVDLSQIIDLEKYPIDQFDHPKTQELITYCRNELSLDGCALISNFVQKSALCNMQQEANRLMPQTFWSDSSHNPYFTKKDETLPENHPKNFFEKRSSGYINSDVLEDHSDLQAIYNSKAVLQFISACLDIEPLYCWADPLGSNPYSVMGHENYFPWHFDGNDFTVSILVQESKEGGMFEYAPDLRSKQDENFEGVYKVLTGEDKKNVKKLQLKEGDLQLFKGRYSMHRVTSVQGNTPRIIALPTYVTDSYAVNRPYHSKVLYGRAMPIHYERESHRPDQLTD